MNTLLKFNLQRLRRLAVLVTAIGCFSPLVFSQSSGTSTSDEAMREYDQIREELAMFYREVKQTRAALDESTFRPEVLARLLGNDPEAMFKYVRDAIAFQPYAGVMRRAEGTLMSGGGNAFDQSLLLTSLFKTHGIETRYARASLPIDLIDKHLQPQTPIQPIRQPGLPPNLDKLERAVGSMDFVRSIADDIKTIDRAILTLGYWQDYALLDKYLKPSKLDPRRQTESLDKDWRQQASQHCWVQARIEGQWVDFDPSALNLNPGERLREETTVSDSLDADELTHKLHVKMLIETDQEDSGLVTVLDETVNLMETVNSIQILTHPESINSVSSVKDAGFPGNINVVWPVLQINGFDLPGQPFDLTGATVSTDVRVRQAQGVRKSTGSGFGAANSALSGLFGGNEEVPTKSEPRLTKIWIDFAMISPDGAVKKQRRLWASRGQSGDDKFDLERLQLSLLSGSQILTNASTLTPEYVIARNLDHFLANRKATFAVLALSARRPLPNNQQILDKGLSHFPLGLLELHARRADVFAGSSLRDFGLWSTWTGGPMIVASRQGTWFPAASDGKPRMWESIDILFNAVDGAPLIPGVHGDQLRELRLRQGIIDTFLEYQLLGGGEQVINTHSVFAAAVAADIAIELINPADSQQVTTAEISEANRQAMNRDLAQGYALLAPIRPVPVDGIDQFAWWRINPKTGTTLGMSELGAGAAMTEYIKNVSISIGFGLGACSAVNRFRFSTWVPQNQEEAWEYAKCVALSAAGGGLGTAMRVSGAATWGQWAARAGAFNAIMCAMARVAAEIEHPLVPRGPRGTLGGAAGREAGGGSGVGGEVGSFAGCMAIGMVLSAGAYGARGGPGGAATREAARRTAVQEAARDAQRARDALRGTGATPPVRNPVAPPARNPAAPPVSNPPAAPPVTPRPVTPPGSTAPPPPPGPGGLSNAAALQEQVKKAADEARRLLETTSRMVGKPPGTPAPTPVDPFQAIKEAADKVRQIAGG